jgi:hypothetical protein
VVRIYGGMMKSIKCLLPVSMVLLSALYASAQEYNTEIQGYYQAYRDFSFQTGYEPLNIPNVKLNGGGFAIAQNLAPWFAFWTQFTFYGSAEQPNLSARIFNNLYGIRYQTQQHGPFQLYAKGGLGYSRYSLDLLGTSYSDTKFSFSYGAGAQIWMSDNFGVVLDASHLIMGLPNLTDLEGREKWDSGLALTAGLSVRF